MKSSIFIVALSTLLSACSQHTPMATVDYVNLDRFMGDWYVIANIPTFIEADAHNAVESYAMNDDGTVAVTFSFREKSFDGEKQVYHPTGFIENTETNALWGMQFIWPIKADYRVVYLDEYYSTTIIGRSARDYVWLMARTPAIAEQDYQRLVKFIGDLGYDTGKIQRVPQQWPHKGESS